MAGLPRSPFPGSETPPLERDTISVKAYPERFETRRQASKGKPVLVRRKRDPAAEQSVLPPASARATRSAAPKTRKKATPPSDPALPATPARAKAESFSDASLTGLLIEAYRHAAEKLHEQWVPVPSLGAALKQLDPQFKANVYGYKDLPTLLQSHPTLFLTRKQATGKTKHIEVWLLTEKER